VTDNDPANGFYTGLTPVMDFRRLTDESLYEPLPDDWVVGVADVVNSTGAIAEGRYKAVNMAGASVISAVKNAVGGAEFPFIFGGDGTGFAIPGGWRDRVAGPFAACGRWAEEETGLTLRTALVPVADIHAAGQEITVARFMPTDHLSYAMFAGGGLNWAESAMKDGSVPLLDAPPGARPDLTGLSCRFEPLAARNGEILSLLVTPDEDGNSAAFETLAGQILDILDRAGERAAHPVQTDGPRFVWPPRNLGMEIRVGDKGPLRILGEHLAAYLMQLFGVKAGEFDISLYRSDVARNTDFRKFDDGLKLTADCPARVIDEIETLLKTAQEEGVARYGLHRQDKALMTCIVPTPTARDHIHFVDGASGGYARAAEMLKEGMSQTG